MRFSAPTSSGQGTLSVLKSWGALQRRNDNGICLDAVVETQPYLWSEAIFVSRRSGSYPSVHLVWTSSPQLRQRVLRTSPTALDLLYEVLLPFSVAEIASGKIACDIAEMRPAEVPYFATTVEGLGVNGPVGAHHWQRRILIRDHRSNRCLGCQVDE